MAKISPKSLDAIKGELESLGFNYIKGIWRRNKDRAYVYRIKDHVLTSNSKDCYKKIDGFIAVYHIKKECERKEAPEGLRWQ